MPPGAAQEEELSDSAVMLPQEKHLQITKQSLWQEGKEPLLNSHPKKGSFLPRDPANCTHRHGLRASPRFLSSHQQLQQLRLQRAARIWGSWWICGECPALSSTRTRVGLHGWSPVHLRKGGRTGSP